MTRPGIVGLVVRGLVIAAGATLVVVATLVNWPWLGLGPTADERRITDLQRLSHAVDRFRMEHDVLPATLARLPREPAAPVHTLDPVTNQPYDYRPLGPLAYELCARFDEALGDDRRDFWWHDAGRHCFALEMREPPKPAVAVPASTSPASAPPDGASAAEPPPADAKPAADGVTPAPPAGAASPTPP